MQDKKINNGMVIALITFPSIDQLMEKADSPYTLVILAARRARQLNMGGKELLNNCRSNKPVSKSLEEIASGKLKYRRNNTKRIK
jgi:DNA-directed RNA polymerase subunit omega